MHGDATFLWLTGLVIALFISILVARANSQRGNREQADRLKAQAEVRQKNEELSALRQSHTNTLAAVEHQLLDHMRGLDKIFDERKFNSHRSLQQFRTFMP